MTSESLIARTLRIYGVDLDSTPLDASIVCAEDGIYVQQFTGALDELTLEAVAVHKKYPHPRPDAVWSTSIETISETASRTTTTHLDGSTTVQWSDAPTED